VTGSVGKTGTKEMLRQCLSRAGTTHASEKSYNNHWGVPLTLARMPVETKFGVFEIGMNHSGEITPLTRMVAPDVGIITTVEPVHIANFNSVTEIAEAKAELLLGLPSGGIAILNRDNPFFDLLSCRAEERDARIVAFGTHADADVRLINASLEHDGSTVTTSVHGKTIRYRIGAPGQHYVMNALAVVAAIEALGADLETCLSALADISAPAGRGARSEIAAAGGKLLLIDESYNANPASMAAALANLGAVPRGAFGRRIAIIGDMRELGTEADALHAKLAPAIEAAGVDLVFACGVHMRALYDALPEARRGAHTLLSTDLVDAVVKRLAPGDAVMIKGSLGTNMAPLVKAVREVGNVRA
jgi:UDP-N-acetylmuramoyl-tripeptide--D-alanyl-D-alanine ligase